MVAGALAARTCKAFRSCPSRPLERQSAVRFRFPHRYEQSRCFCAVLRYLAESALGTDQKKI